MCIPPHRHYPLSPRTHTQFLYQAGSIGVFLCLSSNLSSFVILKLFRSLTNKLVLNVCREKIEAKAVLLALQSQASPLLISRRVLLWPQPDLTRTRHARHLHGETGQGYADDKDPHKQWFFFKVSGCWATLQTSINRWYHILSDTTRGCE